MSFPFFPGAYGYGIGYGNPYGLPLSLRGSFTGCGPPTDCCCNGKTMLRPGDLSRKFIDVSWWFNENMGGVQDGMTLDATLSLLNITDLRTPGTPIVGPGLPLAQAGQFSITVVSVRNADAKDMRAGYFLTFDVNIAATVGNIYRLDYQFTAKDTCSLSVRGTGCELLEIGKCL
jgi:hypothetical protein